MYDGSTGPYAAGIVYNGYDIYGSNKNIISPPTDFTKIPGRTPTNTGSDTSPDFNNLI